jgi:DNA-binding XRE family transcriptional regulator
VHPIGSWFAQVLRFARRDADFSQRELARWSGVAKSTIADIETGRVDVSLRNAVRLLRTAGFEIVVRRVDGDEVGDLLRDDRFDERGRRMPPHLDVIAKPQHQVESERLWQRICDPHRRTRPSRWTFHLDRDHRDIDRLLGHFGVLGIWPRAPVQQDLDWLRRHCFPSGLPG